MVNLTRRIDSFVGRILTAITLTLSPAALAKDESNWTLDFSGQYRARVEDFQRPFVGLSPVDEFTSVAHRLLTGARLSHKSRFGAFAQFGAFVEEGRKPSARRTDKGDPDIQQLYLDVPLISSNTASTVRIGRQEMSFGASRLVSRRNSPNIRRSFDAFRVMTQWHDLSVQAFLARPVQLRPGAFDDKSDQSGTFWGVYGSRSYQTESGVDLYYFGLDRDLGVFDQGREPETRHTIGLRHFGKSAAWNWDSEAAIQFGKFGEGGIRAWFAGGEVSRTWTDSKWSPRLSLRSHIFSGDDDPLDPDLQTFNPLFPNTTYFTRAGLFAPANAIDLHPIVSITPSSNLRLELSADFFWLYSTGDALYQPPLAPRITGSANNKRRLGEIWEVLAKWSPTQRVEVTAAYDIGKFRGFIADAGGKSPRFFLLSIQITL